MSVSRRKVRLYRAPEITGLSLATLRRLVWAGRVHVVKVGNTSWIDLADVDAVLDEGIDDLPRRAPRATAAG